MLKRLVPSRKQNIGSVAGYSANYNARSHSFGDVLADTAGGDIDDGHRGHHPKKKDLKRSASETSLLRKLSGGSSSSKKNGIRPSKSSSSISSLASDSSSSSSSVSKPSSSSSSSSNHNSKSSPSSSSSSSKQKSSTPSPSSKSKSSSSSSKHPTKRKGESRSEQAEEEEVKRDQLALRHRYESQLAQEISDSDDDDEEEDKKKNKDIDSDEEFFSKHKNAPTPTPTSTPSGSSKGSFLARAKKNIAERVATSGIGKAIMNTALDDDGRDMVFSMKRLIALFHGSQEADNAEKNATKLGIKYYFLYERGLLAPPGSSDLAKKKIVQKLSDPLKDAAKCLFSLHVNCKEIRTHPQATTIFRKKAGQAVEKLMEFAVELQSVLKPHLTSNSVARVEEVVALLTQTFFVALFQKPEMDKDRDVVMNLVARHYNFHHPNMKEVCSEVGVSEDGIDDRLISQATASAGCGVLFAPVDNCPLL